MNKTAQLPADTVDAPIALVADDELLLAGALIKELAKLWPELIVRDQVADGLTALDQLTAQAPDVAFLDIRMPGLTGIEVARKLTEDWAESKAAAAGSLPPLLVFVTAYGEFALDAFENAAVDYLLKPVTPARLELCVERLKNRLAERVRPQDADELVGQSPIDQLREQLQKLTAGAAPGRSLKTIRAAVGDTVRMIPIDDVLLLEAADKYVIVHTAGGEALIRESLRDLLDQLDQTVFQQVHRSTIVNMTAVTEAVRNQHGKLALRIKGLEQQPLVSRLYTHLFKAM